MSTAGNICNDSLQQFLTAYDTAYTKFIADEDQWRKEKPSTLISDYPEQRFEEFAPLDNGRGRAGCLQKGLGYVVDRAERPLLLTTYFCKMSVEGIETRLSTWASQRPVFTAPLLEEFICMDCSQNAKNLVDAGGEAAKANLRGIVQSNVQECILNLNKSSASSSTSGPATAAASTALPDLPKMPDIEPLVLPEFTKPSSIISNAPTWLAICLCLICVFCLLGGVAYVVSK